MISLSVKNILIFLWETIPLPMHSLPGSANHLLLGRVTWNLSRTDGPFSLNVSLEQSGSRLALTAVQASSFLKRLPVSVGRFETLSTAPALPYISRTASHSSSKFLFALDKVCSCCLWSKTSKRWIPPKWNHKHTFRCLGGICFCLSSIPPGSEAPLGDEKPSTNQGFQKWNV